MDADAEILALNQNLLDAIDVGDWERYAALVADDLSCFEPEAKGQLVVGLAFHKFYFDLPGARSAQSTMESPHVRFLTPEVAVVSAVRLTQSAASGGADAVAVEETRVWARRDGAWRHVHLHRSRLP